MKFPRIVTVHLYQFENLCDGINAERIQDAKLKEYDSFAVTDSVSLEQEWKKHCTKSKSCCIVEDGENLINSGISSGFETSMIAVHFYERLGYPNS